MDARTYFELSDAIGAAATAEQLEALDARLQATEMHTVERRALERVLRSRADALGLADRVVVRPAPERAD